MDDIRRRTGQVLDAFLDSTQAAGLPPDVGGTIETLLREVDQPATIAIVGRVKAGKSTFLNALLGEDLAVVGTTETTATINHIRYGVPDPRRPVRCHWRSKQVTIEELSFLRSLQGNDVETLRRADAIDHLEFLTPNPWLREVTLIDTPGTGAVVEEHHDRTAEFLRLESQLRTRHHVETARLGRGADAVLYLVGPVARQADKGLLEELSESTGGSTSAFNAIGVLAKIDLQSDLMARRHELSAKIAKQLEDSLNTVLPVSAALQRTLDTLLVESGAGLKQLAETMLALPAARLPVLLSSEEIFCGMDIAGCDVPPAERRSIRGDMPWTVFTTLAQYIVANNGVTERVVESLSEVAGFSRLRETLDTYFVRRAAILRCYRVIADARAVMSSIKFTHTPAMRHQIAMDRERFEQYMDVVRLSPAHEAAKRDLEQFIHESVPSSDRLNRFIARQADIEHDLALLFHELVEYNEDFAALQQLAEHAALFSDEDLAELRAVLGLYGLDLESRLAGRRPDHGFIQSRQQYWAKVRSFSTPDSPRLIAAHRAFIRYGLILHQFARAASQPVY